MKKKRQVRFESAPFITGYLKTIAYIDRRITTSNKLLRWGFLQPAKMQTRKPSKGKSRRTPFLAALEQALGARERIYIYDFLGQLPLCVLERATDIMLEMRRKYWDHGRIPLDGIQLGDSKGSSLTSQTLLSTAPITESSPGTHYMINPSRRTLYLSGKASLLPSPRHKSSSSMTSPHQTLHP